MKLIYNSFIPFRGYYAMNLFGVVFIRRKYDSEDYRRLSSHKTMLNHESIHTAQMKELLYVGFYILYLFEWVVRLITPPWNTAYRDISFEREAYGNEDNPEYLKTRRPYAWLKYVIKK